MGSVPMNACEQYEQQHNNVGKKLNGIMSFGLSAKLAVKRFEQQ